MTQSGKTVREQSLFGGLIGLAPESPRPRAFWIAIWFGSWAGGGGLLGLSFAPSIGAGRDFGATVVLSLLASGAVAGALLRRWVRRVVCRRLWIEAAVMGVAVAFVALELGVVLTSLGIGEPEAVLVGWIFGPLFGSPVLVTFGPLSGIVAVLALGRRSASDGPPREEDVRLPGEHP